MIHLKRAHWEKMLDWITRSAPVETSTAEEIQIWLLVTGMVLRDISVVNSVNPDEPEEPVIHDGPEYFRNSTASFSDMTKIILPTCASAYHALAEAAASSGAPASVAAAAPPITRSRAVAHVAPASTFQEDARALPEVAELAKNSGGANNPTSTSKNIVKAKRGGPPGLRVLTAGRSEKGDSSEMDVGMKGGDAAGREGASTTPSGKSIPYVLITSRPPGRVSSARGSSNSAQAPEEQATASGDGQEAAGIASGSGQDPAGGADRSGQDEAGGPARQTRSAVNLTTPEPVDTAVALPDEPPAAPR